MKFARIKNGKVVETINFSPAGKFHPSIEWQEVPVEVEQHWTTEDGDIFTPPPVSKQSEPTVPEPEPAPTLSVVKFKLCFTSAERLAIYALKDSGDVVITDWLSILDDPRAISVDLGLTGIHDAVHYLVGKIPGFDAARATEVLSGKLI